MQFYQLSRIMSHSKPDEKLLKAIDENSEGNRKALKNTMEVSQLGM